MRKYYVGLDVHKVTIAIAVLDAYGKLITRTVIETTTEAVRDFLRNLTGMREEMARLAVARKLSATVLAVWKSGESFDAEDPEESSIASSETSWRIKEKSPPCRKRFKTGSGEVSNAVVSHE